MSFKVRWWDASLSLWILAKVTTCFMESPHLLNIVFVYLPGGKSTGPGGFHFSYIYPLKYLNLLLISGTKLDGHRGTSGSYLIFLELKYLLFCGNNLVWFSFWRRENLLKHEKLFEIDIKLTFYRHIFVILKFRFRWKLRY